MKYNKNIKNNPLIIEAIEKIKVGELSTVTYKIDEFLQSKGVKEPHLGYYIEFIQEWIYNNC